MCDDSLGPTLEPETIRTAARRPNVPMPQPPGLSFSERCVLLPCLRCHADSLPWSRRQDGPPMGSVTCSQGPRTERQTLPPHASDPDWHRRSPQPPPVREPHWMMRPCGSTANSSSNCCGPPTALAPTQVSSDQSSRVRRSLPFCWAKQRLLLQVRGGVK